MNMKSDARITPTFGLSVMETRQTLLQLAHLHIQTEHYAEAAALIERYLNMPAPGWESAADKRAPLYLIAACACHLHQYDRALSYMETLFALRGDYPESWYAMLATLYFKTGKPDLAKPILERMVANFDKQAYRDALAQINAGKRVCWRQTWW
jgi:tetratricopeptide (TPR) repeat protein